MWDSCARECIISTPSLARCIFGRNCVRLSEKHHGVGDGDLGDAEATAARPAEDGAAACPAEDDDAGSDAVAIKEDGALPSAPAGPARPGAARNGSARPGLGSV